MRIASLISVLIFFSVCATVLSGVASAQRTAPVRKPPAQVDDTPPATKQAIDNAIRLLEQRDFAGAEAEARNAVKLSPRSAVAFNVLGIVLDEQGKSADALTAFSTAIKLAPTFISPKNNLGRLLANQGKLAEALAQFEAVLKIEPTHLQARYNAAAIYAETSKFDKSAEYFALLLKANPADLQLSMAFLNVAYRANRTDEANALADSLETRFSTELRGLFSLGVVLAQGQQYERALRIFRRANEIQPNTFEILYNLGLVLDNLKRQDEAVELLAQAADLKPEAVEVHFRLGVIASERNDHSNAAEEFRHCIDLDPKTPITIPCLDASF
ncbi:MAG: tetratricopeptide repeat protein [Acidobacteria bacterium]|nr:tetratricopeptide repeat protein [Acidobacteriota bacterium]